jgi:hypothetical protein
MLMYEKGDSEIVEIDTHIPQVLVDIVNEALNKELSKREPTLSVSPKLYDPKTLSPSWRILEELDDGKTRLTEFKISIINTKNV